MVWFMTDPRFYGWLWEIENEIRAEQNEKLLELIKPLTTSIISSAPVSIEIPDINEPSDPNRLLLRIIHARVKTRICVFDNLHRTTQTQTRPDTPETA